MMNRKLSAKFQQLQIERVLRAETIADLLAAEVDLAVRKSLRSRNVHRTADILRGIPDKLEKTLGPLLEKALAMVSPGISLRPDWDSPQDILERSLRVHNHGRGGHWERGSVPSWGQYQPSLRT